VASNRGGQPADHWVLFGLADQPGQLASEMAVLGGQCSQDLSQHANRRRVLRASDDLVQDRPDLAVRGDLLDQSRELDVARPDADPGLTALVVEGLASQQAGRGCRCRVEPLRRRHRVVLPVRARP
jgi:hypothetical protein